MFLDLQLKRWLILKVLPVCVLLKWLDSVKYLHVLHFVLVHRKVPKLELVLTEGVLFVWWLGTGVTGCSVRHDGMVFLNCTSGSMPFLLLFKRVWKRFLGFLYAATIWKFLNNSTLVISLRQLFTRLALNELYSVTMGRISLESLPAVLVETWCQTCQT